MWKKNQDPEVFTLSSDDEEENTTVSSIYNNLNIGSCEFSKEYEPINPKEPIIIPNSNYSDWKMQHKNISCDLYECGNSKFEDSSSSLSLYLQCQSVRIGSYKVIPQERVKLSSKEIKIVVPPFAEGETDPVDLTFPLKNVRKILAHLDEQTPKLFVYVMDPHAKVVRDLLKMNDKNGFYFNPCSHEESQKRLTIISENLKQDTKDILRNIFNFSLINKDEEMQLFEEITSKDAVEIFVRSSPAETDSLVVNNARSSVIYETQTLLVFPPPPNKGGITITVDDYLCLKEEQFLNDVLIDFYLKWLHMRHMKPEDRERTHLFSTFFYKRLTAKPKNNHRPNYETDPKLSPAERRHARVQSWTKNVDIFSKDFLLIPINEKSHWFLAVICFPYLNGPVNAHTGELIPAAEVNLSKRRVSARVRQKVEIPVIDDIDGSDRDEAEGDDCELEDFDCDDQDPNYSELDQKKKSTSSNVHLKQPCILILDSISGSRRSNIVSTLRDYLSVEHAKRKQKMNTFTSQNMMGACPKVPQQMNYTDCGVFTLQYAQSFFETPIEDFRLPIRSIEDWFKQDDVAKKRTFIANVIKSLMDELKPNHGITLPSLSVSNQEETRDLTAENGKDSLQNSESESMVETNAKDVKCSETSNNVSANNCPDEVYDEDTNHSPKSVELSDSSEPLDINGFSFKNVPKINVPIKTLSSSSLNTTGKCTSQDNGFNIPNSNKDTVLETNPVTGRDSSNLLPNSCHDLPIKTNTASKSLELICDSYSNVDDDIDDDDDDEIFPSAKNKRLKLSTPVDL